MSKTRRRRGRQKLLTNEAHNDAVTMRLDDLLKRAHGLLNKRAIAWMGNSVIISGRTQPVKLPRKEKTPILQEQRRAWMRERRIVMLAIGKHLDEGQPQ